jgi:hypothetical protein
MVAVLRLIMTQNPEPSHVLFINQIHGELPHSLPPQIIAALVRVRMNARHNEGFRDLLSIGNEKG